MIPIGRIGCLLYGCCLGTLCAPWMARFCPRYPPGTEAYTQQIRDGVIPLSAQLSLPAHPLPVYFALASLGTLAVLVIGDHHDQRLESTCDRFPQDPR